MSAFVRGGWVKRLGMAAIVLGGALSGQPGLAQTRTLATLSDVPVYVPAPYHQHIFASYYSAAAPYDSHPYYGGNHSGVGTHHWH